MRTLPPSALALALILAGCTKSEAPPPPEGDAPDLGEVMVQVGRRFELAGRASAAGRFELASFEVGELGETFEHDVLRAHLPKEGPTAHIPALAKAFLATVPPDLGKAAATRDKAQFGAAFARAAQACNGCHQASGKAFIEIPTVPGGAVPVVE